VAAAGALLACRPTAGLLIEEDVAGIRQTERGYIEAVLAGDWAAAAGFFTADAVHMPMDAPVARGRSAIAARLGELGAVTQWTVSASEVSGEGRLAYIRSAYTIEASASPGETPSEYTGKSLAILKRQPDGRWLYVADIWNSDAPLQRPAASDSALGETGPP